MHANAPIASALVAVVGPVPEPALAWREGDVALGGWARLARGGMMSSNEPAVHIGVRSSHRQEKHDQYAMRVKILGL